MSVIKMYGYEAAQQTEYQTKKWATKEEMQALSSGDEQRDVILAKGATVAFYEDDKHWETSVSNNVFAFGGTGSGKRRVSFCPTCSITTNAVMWSQTPRVSCCAVLGKALKRTATR